MIQINQLSFCYQGMEVPSLADIDLSVERGEFVLLTGESGCGKTTLTRVLNGLCPQFFPGAAQGEYLLDGQDALALSLDEIGLRIGNVFQDPRSQFFTTNTTDEIVMAMENRNFPLPLMRGRVTEICGLLHLDGLLDRSLFQLSSGEKQKIAIAAACAIHPKVVVLDEPSANLDAAGTEQLAHFLEKLKAQGITIVVSEHRLHYLSHLIDRMVVLDKGRIKRVYSAREVRNISPEELIAMGLRLLKVTAADDAAPENQAPALLQVSGLAFSRQKKSILHSLSLSLPQGKIMAVTGDNGAGKSTACKIISGILREDSGQILLHGAPAKKRQRLKSSFFIGQDADYQLFASTVLDEITLNIKPRHTLLDEAKSILNRLNLSEFQNRHPVSLSGGQKQRVLLAAALLRNNPVLVLDEPTSGLDGKHMRIVAGILREIAGQGVSILLITHDTEFSNMVAELSVHLKDGTLAG